MKYYVMHILLTKHCAHLRTYYVKYIRYVGVEETALVRNDVIL